MKLILAEKKEMTQKFTDDGKVVPVTKVVAGPCVITQIKDQSKDGYVALQIGFGLKKKLTKPLAGHLKKLGNFQYLKEFRVSEEEIKDLKVGDKISAKAFETGDKIKVTGKSKGKGFQGVVKRYGFHGSPASHGHKDQLRMPGSIGATGPAHVFKGTKMGGQMGNERVTVTNLEVVDVNIEKGEIFIKGAVPGPRNNLLLISGAGDLIIEKEEKPVEKKEESNVEEKVTEKKEEVKSDEKKVEKKTEEKKEEKSVKENKQPQKSEVKKEESKKVEAKKEDK